MTYTKTQIERHIDDFTIRANRSEVWVEFEVYEIAGWHDEQTPCYGNDFDPTPGDPDLSARVKWDGCSDWTIDSFHACTRSQIIRFSKLFERLYDIALELMPEHKENLT